ncbi:hypothetical protein NAPIS_ORF02351 [Vairimorpha apis BRL 01]|uniref:Uncharacterized protein n=1 Tax=Vairimorpha apis BRL 01 TaxID=1037528 RepID=T0KXF6_9MICR|nr:hypothetical protein NAPIS_ORF02351 [Vairimorpha apis BRL 01]
MIEQIIFSDQFYFYNNITHNYNFKKSQTKSDSDLNDGNNLLNSKRVGNNTSVDHMATRCEKMLVHDYKNCYNKINSYIDTTIKTYIKNKYNKTDIVIIYKKSKEILIVKIDRKTLKSLNTTQNTEIECVVEIQKRRQLDILNSFDMEATI